MARSAPTFSNPPVLSRSGRVVAEHLRQCARLGRNGRLDGAGRLLAIESSGLRRSVLSATKAMKLFKGEVGPEEFPATR